MYAAVVTALQAFSDSLGIAGLPAKLQLLIAKIALIYDLAVIQTKGTRGRTAQRDELSQGMIDLALDVASAVGAHAVEQQLTELAKSVEVSAATFRRMRIVHRPILAQQIHDAALPIIEDLAPYKITAQTLADLQARIGLVKAALDDPRSLIRSKTAATAQLVEAFREADALLEGQIDRLMFPVRKTHPELYADYQLARQVWDAPRGGAQENDEALKAAAALVNAPPLAATPAASADAKAA